VQNHPMEYGYARVSTDGEKKRTASDRMPLQWAASTGSQGIALGFLAERRGDLAMAEHAQVQIKAAVDTSREAGQEPNAAYFEAQLSAVHALIEACAIDDARSTRPTPTPVHTGSVQSPNTKPPYALECPISRMIQDGIMREM
jgi:hypothetical protein